MKQPHALLPVIAAIAVFSACSEDEPPEIDLGHDYFPINVGHWVEYQVDSLRVRNNGADSTHYSYALREEIVENITDGEGRPAQRIIRYTHDANGVWVPKDVWWQTREQVRAERSEENLRRIKLVFPPRSGTEWNTNATNIEQEFGLKYDEVDQPFSVNGLSFEKTVQVVGTYEPNLIFTKNYSERYARGVGMVVHEVDSINDQQNTYDRFYVKYTITGHGN